jgi:hypothetical protein
MPDPPSPAAPWHALFAPLPEGAVPQRKPIASPEVLASPHGAAIAGWEQLTIELSARDAGLRVAMVVVDADDQPLSASDWVMYRVASGADGTVTWYHHSVGGRLEPDGSFRGTRWYTVGTESPGDEEPRIDATPSPPDDSDVAGIAALVAELLRRAPPRMPRAAPGS